MARNPKDSSGDLNKIHLVSRDEARDHRNTAGPSSNRIEIGEYIADILVDRRSFPVVVHWIVQRRNSPDILQWGHAESFELATQKAMQWIGSLEGYDECRRKLNR